MRIYKDNIFGIIIRIGRVEFYRSALIDPIKAKMASSTIFAWRTLRMQIMTKECLKQTLLIEAMQKEKEK